MPVRGSFAFIEVVGLDYVPSSPDNKGVAALNLRALQYGVD